MIIKFFSDVFSTPDKLYMHDILEGHLTNVMCTIVAYSKKKATSHHAVHYIDMICQCGKNKYVLQ